jgi:hypothetical protein
MSQKDVGRNLRGAVEAPALCFATANNAPLAALDPGFGIVKTEDRSSWNAVLKMLPSEIAQDPSAQFINPALTSALEKYLTEQAAMHGVETLSLEQYQTLAQEKLGHKKIKTFLTTMNELLKEREENPYHGGYHSRVEVPQRVQDVTKNLSSALSKEDFGILMCAAAAHDLMHAATGYAQRLTPGLNISNEERAVIHATQFALEAGFNPVHALQLQLLILPTSFFQKPEQLGLAQNPDATVPLINEVDLSNFSFDGTVWNQQDKTVKKECFARTYDPDASKDPHTKLMAQVLTLADILVTYGVTDNTRDAAFRSWIETAGNLFLEARHGQGYFPPTVEAFASAQSDFIKTHTRARLDALKPHLKEEFYNEHIKRIETFAQRLQDAVNNTTSEDGILLAKTVNTYLNSTPKPPKVQGLGFE